MRVHSEVGLITNSSSECYTYATAEAESRMNQFINAILKAAGSDKTAAELFDIELTHKPAYYVDDMIQYIEEQYTEPEKRETYVPDYYPDGLQEIKITPKPGVNVSEDLSALINGLVDAEQFSNEL